MAWEFTRSESDWVQVADNANLSLPDDVWSMAGWVKFNDLTSAGQFHTVFNWGDPFAGAGITNPSMTLYANNNFDRLSFRAGDDDTTDIDAANSANNDLTEGTWHHIILTRDSTPNFNMYIDNVSVYSVGISFFDTLNVADIWEWGRDEVPEYGELDLAEWAYWNGTLFTSQDRTDLQTLEPDTITDAGAPTWYIPMYDDFTAAAGSLSITNNGATANSANHPITVTGGGGGAVVGIKHGFSKLGTKLGQKQV